MEANNNDDLLNSATTGEYKYGFTSDIDTNIIPKGLNEDVVRYISAKKGEPSGSWNFASRLSATGSHSPCPNGPISTSPKSTSRTSATMPSL